MSERYPFQKAMMNELKQVLARRFAPPNAIRANDPNDPPLVMMPNRCREMIAQQRQHQKTSEETNNPFDIAEPSDTKINIKSNRIKHCYPQQQPKDDFKDFYKRKTLNETSTLEQSHFQSQPKIENLCINLKNFTGLNNDVDDVDVNENDNNQMNMQNAVPNRLDHKAELLKYKHFILSVYQDYLQLPHLTLNILKLFCDYCKKAKARLRMLWENEPKSSERRKLISYLSTYCKINDIFDSLLKQKEEMQMLEMNLQNGNHNR